MPVYSNDMTKKLCRRCGEFKDLKKFVKEKGRLCWQCKGSSPQYHPDPRVRLWNYSKFLAESKFLEHDITPEDIELPEFCPRTGERLNYHSVVLVRIDKNKGYVLGNFQVVSSTKTRWSHLPPVYNPTENLGLRYNSAHTPPKAIL